MMLVDSRVGSGDLVTRLAALGVPAELTTLEYGDVACVGHGPDGLIPLGIEIKTLPDLLASMTSGRLAGHQLPGLTKTFGPWVWIMVEGIWSIADDGTLQTRRGGTWEPVTLGPRRYLWTEFQRYLMTLTNCGGATIVTTTSRNETTRWLAAWYQWWTSKEFSEHHSHLALHRKTRPEGSGYLTAPSPLRRVVAELPGIGYTKSAAVEAHFKTIHHCATAGVEEWEQIPGIGPVIAAKVVQAIKGT